MDILEILGLCFWGVVFVFLGAFFAKLFGVILYGILFL